MAIMSKFIAAVRNGVPATAVRLAGQPHDEWTVSTSMEGAVVLSRDKVRKKAELWLAHVKKELHKAVAGLGVECTPSTTDVEVCVGGQWMPLGRLATSPEEIPVHNLPRQNKELRTQWMQHFATPFFDGNGKCSSVYNLTNRQMRADLDSLPTTEKGVMELALAAAGSAVSAAASAAAAAGSAAASSVAAAASSAAAAAASSAPDNLRLMLWAHRDN